MRNGVWAVFLLLLAGCSGGDSETSDEYETGLSNSVRIDEFIRWLPVDTETVIVAAEPGQMMSDHDGEVEIAKSCTFVAAIGMPGKEPHKWLQNYRLIVSGTRNYRIPKGLGLLPYEGCKIISLAPDDLLKLEKQVKETAKKAIQVEGLTAYVYEERLEQDDWTWYLVFDGLLFCSTSENYLVEVLRRRAGKRSADRALPASLEEWKYVDKNSALWGLRHFTDASNQLTSGANMDDPKLVGYTLSLSKDKKSLEVVTISNSPDASAKAREMWEGFFTQEDPSQHPQLTELDKRTTRIKFDASRKDRGQVLFLILGAFGHAVFF